MILYFAEQGYLTIEQTNKKKFILHKQCEIPQTEKKFARTLFDGLFGKYGDVQLEELDEEFGEAYMTASEQLAGLYRSKHTQISLLSTLLQLLGCAFCFLVLTVVVVFTGLYNGQFAPGVAGGILGGLLMIASLLVLLYFQRKSLRSFAHEVCQQKNCAVDREPDRRSDLCGSLWDGIFQRGRRRRMPDQPGGRRVLYRHDGKAHEAECRDLG